MKAKGWMIPRDDVCMMWENLMRKKVFFGRSVVVVGLWNVKVSGRSDQVREDGNFFKEWPVAYFRPNALIFFRFFDSQLISDGSGSFFAVFSGGQASPNKSHTVID